LQSAKIATTLNSPSKRLFVFDVVDGDVPPTKAAETTAEVPLPPMAVDFSARTSYFPRPSQPPWSPQVQARKKGPIEKLALFSLLAVNVVIATLYIPIVLT
jgi:hypothetical protein